MKVYILSCLVLLKSILFNLLCVLIHFFFSATVTSLIRGFIVLRMFYFIYCMCHENVLSLQLLEGPYSVLGIKEEDIPHMAPIRQDSMDSFADFS